MVKYTIIHNTTTIQNGVEYTKVIEDYNNGQVLEVKKRKAEMEMKVAMNEMERKYNIPKMEMDKLLILIEAEQKSKAIANAHINTHI